MQRGVRCVWVGVTARFWGHCVQTGSLKSLHTQMCSSGSLHASGHCTQDVWGHCTQMCSLGSLHTDVQHGVTAHTQHEGTAHRCAVWGHCMHTELHVPAPSCCMHTLLHGQCMQTAACSAGCLLHDVQAAHSTLAAESCLPVAAASSVCTQLHPELAAYACSPQPPSADPLQPSAPLQPPQPLSAARSPPL